MTQGAEHRTGRLAAWEWLAFAAVFLAAVFLRMQLVDADYFSDEPMSYALSRHGFSTPTNVHEVDGSPTWHYPKSWYLERPAFYAAMAPAAMISFTAYRVEYILIASLIAPLGAALLRALDVRPMLAYAAGLVLAMHPQFVLWGTITHMDTPMTVALAAGFLLSQSGRHAWAALMFVLAVWTKETAMPFLVFVLMADLAMETWRNRRFEWPLRFDGRRSALFAGVLFGFVPFLLAQEMFFGLPGERASVPVQQLFDMMFLGLWLFPLVGLGLLWPRTRLVSVWGLALPAFYLFLRLGFDWNVRAWYMVGSGFFAIVAALTALDEAWRRLHTIHPRAWMAGAASGCALFLLSAAAVAVPDGQDKRAWLHPLSRIEAPSLEEMLRAENSRNLNDRQFLAALRDAAPQKVLVVDIHYAFVQHPVPEYAADVRAFTTFDLHERPDVTRDFVDAAEQYADLTVVRKTPEAANVAIRTVYADCTVNEAETFVFMDIRGCQGRFDELYRAIAFEGADA